MEESASKDKLGLSFPSKCPRCGSRTLVRDYERGEIICDACGFVVEEGLKDRGPEWRAYDREEKGEKSRGGPPKTETIHDRGLSTQIDYKNRDSTGRSLSPEQRQKAYRIRKWHKKGTIGSGGKRLASAFRDIWRMVSQLGLPKSVSEKASLIYRKAFEEGLIRGRSMECVASAALYAACRMDRISRTLVEISEVSRVGRGKVRRCHLKLSRDLNLNLPPVDPSQYVPRFGDRLNVSGEVKAKALKIIRRAREANLTSGKSPPGIAAAAIYAAAQSGNGRVTQDEAARVADVTVVTVRNHYHKLSDKLDLGESDNKKASASGNPGGQSENKPSSETNCWKTGKENRSRPDRGTPSVGWLESNLHLYKILTEAEESPKSFRGLALSTKLTYPEAEKRTRKLAERGLVKIEEGENTKVEVTKKGRRAPNRITTGLVRDGEGDAVVVRG